APECSTSQQNRLSRGRTARSTSPKSASARWRRFSYSVIAAYDAPQSCAASCAISRKISSLSFAGMTWLTALHMAAPTGMGFATSSGRRRRNLLDASQEATAVIPDAAIAALVRDPPSAALAARVSLLAAFLASQLIDP